MNKYRWGKGIYGLTSWCQHFTRKRIGIDGGDLLPLPFNMIYLRYSVELKEGEVLAPFMQDVSMEELLRDL